MGSVRLINLSFYPEAPLVTWLAMLALFAYLLLSGHYIRQILPKHPGGLLPMPLTNALLIAGSLSHAAALTIKFQAYPWHFGASEALSLTALLCVTLYGLGRSILPLKGTEAPLLAFAAFMLAISLVLPPGHAITSSDLLSRIHFACALLTQPLLIIATGMALLIKHSNRQLHNTHKGILARALPPVLTLEKLLFIALGAAYAMLSAALLTGLLASLDPASNTRFLSHKVLLSILAWIVIGILLIGHRRAGWRGRLAANWTLAGAALLFLGYLGTRLVLEVILKR